LSLTYIIEHPNPTLKKWEELQEESCLPLIVHIVTNCSKILARPPNNEEKSPLHLPIINIGAIQSPWHLPPIIQKITHPTPELDL
jgi:hypothetical protein